MIIVFELMYKLAVIMFSVRIWYINTKKHNIIYVIMYDDKIKECDIIYDIIFFKKIK